MLLDVILTTLRGDGSVLIPVDAAGRVLELVLLLEEFWSREK
jgi:cleavage and polyadenylation specificity factor subunit 2